VEANGCQQCNYNCATAALSCTSCSCHCPKEEHTDYAHDGKPDADRDEMPYPSHDDKPEEHKPYVEEKEKEEHHTLDRHDDRKNEGRLYGDEAPDIHKEEAHHEDMTYGDKAADNYKEATQEERLTQTRKSAQMRKGGTSTEGSMTALRRRGCMRTGHTLARYMTPLMKHLLQGGRHLMKRGSILTGPGQATKKAPASMLRVSAMRMVPTNPHTQIPHWQLMRCLDMKAGILMTVPRAVGMLTRVLTSPEGLAPTTTGHLLTRLLWTQR
jgi:hypothetical protein